MVDIIGDGMSLAGQIATGITGGPNLIEEGKRMADAGIGSVQQAVMPSVSNIHAIDGVSKITTAR
jgi:hypothetical protein